MAIIDEVVSDLENTISQQCEEIELLKAHLSVLILAAEPFTTGDLVTELVGTIPFIEALDSAISKIKGE